MSFTKTEVIDLLTGLAVKYGPQLLEDAFNAEPRLYTDPLPKAEEEMYDARADAIRRAGGVRHDTDRELAAVIPPNPDDEPKKA
jgi:hypothetical protein